MTPQEIIEEIHKLPPGEQQIVKESFENGKGKPQMTEDEFLQILLAKGMISEIPDRSKYTDEDDDWEPIEIDGIPTSELIIQERR